MRTHTHTHTQTFSFMARHPIVGQSLPSIEASRSHSDTPQPVGLLWTSDQADAVTSTWKHTTLISERHL